MWRPARSSWYWQPSRRSLTAHVGRHARTAERGENVAAAVVLRDGASLDRDALHARLKGELSAYKLPRHYFFVTSAEIPDDR